MSWQIVQIMLNDMIDIVKCIRHSTLESSTCILQTEGEFPVGESTPRTNKIHFMLVLRSDIDLIIAGKSIHEGKDFTAGTVIDDLVNERGWKILLWTSFVDIPIINTNAYTTTLFINRYWVRNPFCQCHGVNEIGFKKFFNFEFNSCRFTWMDRMEALLDWFTSGVCLNFMNNDSRVNSRHLFITPGKDIAKFLKQGSISDNFFGRTRSSKMNILDNSRFH
jgi:hypothetical protein